MTTSTLKGNDTSPKTGRTENIKLVPRYKVLYDVPNLGERSLGCKSSLVKKDVQRKGFLLTPLTSPRLQDFTKNKLNKLKEYLFQTTTTQNNNNKTKILYPRVRNGSDRTSPW